MDQARTGYTYNDATLHSPIDGRDLWSRRVSLLIHPIEKLTATAVWEHFSEDDDRLRSAKSSLHEGFRDCLPWMDRTGW